MTTRPRPGTIVVHDRSNGLGTIIGILVIVALVTGIWYFAFGPGRGTIPSSDQPNRINVDVNLPSIDPSGS